MDAEETHTATSVPTNKHKTLPTISTPIETLNVVTATQNTINIDSHTATGMHEISNAIYTGLIRDYFFLCDV